MKYSQTYLRAIRDQSLPARGAWIEICQSRFLLASAECRSPHGERGLKWSAELVNKGHLRRSPHGERGLKYNKVHDREDAVVSLPARGAWIEIPRSGRSEPAPQRRSPHGERGLKSRRIRRVGIDLQSLPARGAWIEIASANAEQEGKLVAPRTGSVD